MDVLTEEQVAEAKLTDWRKLGRGLHARYVVGDVGVWVPPEVAERRIAAAVAAGGTVVDDTHAPSYTVIADQDGNKACVCTTLPPAHDR